MGMNPHGSKLNILKAILWIESIPVTRGEENNPVGIKHLCMNSFYLGIASSPALWLLQNHQIAEVYLGKCAQALRCGGMGDLQRIMFPTCFFSAR